MFKILVADPLAEEGLAKLRQTPEVQFDVRVGMSPQEFAAAVADYDGLIIRSGVKVTKDVLAKPGKLRGIARAGVGVDNVDLDAATTAGVLVMNTPDANTLSTAEHTMAMMLAAMRRIPAAHAHVTGGGWKRGAYVGDQLAGKTLGIVGLGRVGRAVAERALAFQMKVLAYDPFFRADTALEGRVSVVKDIDALLPQVDCLTLHAALTDDTRNLISAARLKKMKSTAIVINCARGGLVEEAALAEMLNSGAIAGAAIDVFESEPPKDCPLLAAKNIVLTPHLGASTQEAQTAVSTEAVEVMLDYLLRGTIRNAVNVTGLPSDLSAKDRANLDLTNRMAAILSAWSGDGVDRVEVTTSAGDSFNAIGQTLALQAVVGMMNRYFEGRLNLVNVRGFTQQQGIDVRHVADSSKQDFPDSIRVRFERGSTFHEVQGAVFMDQRPRVLAIDGYRMEIVPEGRLVLIFNDDRPGVIGQVGTLFGNWKVNIADMSLSRRDNRALMVIKSDGAISDEMLDELKKSDAILSVRTISL